MKTPPLHQFPFSLSLQLKITVVARAEILARDFYYRKYHGDCGNRRFCNFSLYQMYEVNYASSQVSIPVHVVVITFDRHSINFLQASMPVIFSFCFFTSFMPLRHEISWNNSNNNYHQMVTAKQRFKNTLAHFSSAGHFSGLLITF